MKTKKVTKIEDLFEGAPLTVESSKLISENYRYH